MTELKDLWADARYAAPTTGPDNLTYVDDLSDKLHGLRKQEAMQEKWKPFTIGFVGLMSVGFLAFFYAVGAITSVYGFLGVLLILAAGGCLVAAAYAVQIPMDDFDLAAPSSYFLGGLREQLTARARNFRWGMVAQLLLLSAGLFLIYWQEGLPRQNPEAWIGIHLGVTGALCGLVYGMSSAGFKLMHGKLLEAIGESGMEEFV